MLGRGGGPRRDPGGRPPGAPGRQCGRPGGSADRSCGQAARAVAQSCPRSQRLAVMGNIHTLNVAFEMNEVQSVGPKFGIEVTRLEITKQEDIVPGLEALKDRVDGLYVCTDPLLTTYRTLINTLAVREKLPTVHAFREYVLAGGLMSYGPNFPDLF